jgi:hypothetical protein
MRTADPALAWLRSVLAKAAASLSALSGDTRDSEGQFPVEVPQI